MLNIAKESLNAEGIERVGMLSLSECDIINPRILPEGSKSIIIFCIPYRSTCAPPRDGFSEYARVYDYHKFSSELFGRILPELENASAQRCFGFCDHSPINEKLAAAKCGLGVIGRHSLFIDDIYGSFVFLGSILTTADCSEPTHEVKTCTNCGACIKSCPSNAMLNKGIDRGLCLSAISQRRIKTESEKEKLAQNKIVWGCDICQLACPHNKNAKISPLPYFKKTRISHIDKDFIESLSDEEFRKYAFAYKGRQIVLNNLEIL